MQTESWRFFDSIGETQAVYGMESSAEDFRIMKSQLKDLAERSAQGGVR